MSSSASIPFNAHKAAEHEPAPGQLPPAGVSVKPGDPIVGSSTVQESQSSEKVGSGSPVIGTNKTNRHPGPGARRLDRSHADDQSGRAHWRQPEFAEGRPARSDAARRLHPPREDHPLRPRAHSRAHRPRPRLGGAWLLRELRVARALHAGRPLLGGRQEDAGLRPLLDRARRARFHRHGARRARLRGEVLYRGGQLGSGRQQHAGLLHPGRDEVSRTWCTPPSRSRTLPCRRPARLTTPSGTSPR